MRLIPIAPPSIAALRPYPETKCIWVSHLQRDIIVEDMEVNYPSCLVCSFHPENPSNHCFCHEYEEVNFDVEALGEQFTNSVGQSVPILDYLDHLIHQSIEYPQEIQLAGDGLFTDLLNVSCFLSLSESHPFC
jgi:hypothetical protein